MELFNNKVLMTTDLYPPQFSFDADNYNLKFDLKDERDLSRIEYRFIGAGIVGDEVGVGNYVPVYLSTKIPYNLPQEDLEYSIQYRILPRNSKYKIATYTDLIYKNNANCKYFVYGSEYGDDNKHSNSIYRYIGTEGTMTVPNKHNLVPTLVATLNEFPYVSSNTIEITTRESLIHLDLIKDGQKDQRIRKIRIGSNDFQPMTDQFSDLSNLTNVYGDFRYVSTRMFKNCPQLVLDPFVAEKAQSIGSQAFYNTPNVRKLILNVDNITEGTFDYSSSYTGYNDYQKILFTQKNLINNLDQQDLALGLLGLKNYTGGMLYTNPETNEVEKHLVFCGLDTNWWTDTVPLDDTIEFVEYTQHSNTDPTLKFHSNSQNILGMEIFIYSSNNMLKGARLWIPGDLRRSSGNVVDNYRDGNDFYISASLLEFDESVSSQTITIPGNSTDLSIILSGITAAGFNPTDRIYIRPITSNGLSENVYQYLYSGGSFVDQEPSTPIHEVGYTAGKTGYYTLSIDETWSRELGGPSATSYILYITLDEELENADKKLRVRLRSSESDSSIQKGINYQFTGLREEEYDLSSSQYWTINGRKVYAINLNDSIHYSIQNGNTLVDTHGQSGNIGTKVYAEIGYKGYPFRYTLPLKEKLTGTTS